MKKLIVVMTLFLLAIISNAQVYKGYVIEAKDRLEAKKAFVLGGDSVYSTTKVSTKDTIIVTKKFLTDGFISKIQNELTHEPTGFEHPEDVVVNYNPTTRKITLTGNTTALWKGDTISILTSGWQSEAHAAINGQWFLYYNGSAFIWSQNIWEFNVVQIAFINYPTFAIRETHGLMQYQTHKELHETVGTYLQSGGDVSGYVLSSTTTANRRPIVSSTSISDEDNTSIEPSLATGSYTVFSLTGANTVNFSLSQADIVPLSGNRPYYNQWNGSAWVQTLMANNSYMDIWLYAIPVAADAGSQAYRYIWVQGQTNGSLSTVQSIFPPSLSLGNLASLAPEIVCIGKIIIQYTGANWTFTEVSKLTGSRFSQTSISGGNYLSLVQALPPLLGLGTVLEPLYADTISPTKSLVTVYDIRNMVTAANNFGTNLSVLVSDGTAKGAKAQGVGLTMDASNNMSLYGGLKNNGVFTIQSGLPNGVYNFNANGTGGYVFGQTSGSGSFSYFGGGGSAKFQVTNAGVGTFAGKVSHAAATLGTESALLSQVTAAVDTAVKGTATYIPIFTAANKIRNSTISQSGGITYFGTPAAIDGDFQFNGRLSMYDLSGAEENWNLLTRGEIFAADGFRKLISDTVNATGYATNYKLTTGLLTKQNQLNGTGFVKANGTVITYDNNTYYYSGNSNTTGANWSSNVNNSLQYNLNGVNINTAGTLSNVAYKNQTNTFTTLNTFSYATPYIRFYNTAGSANARQFYTGVSADNFFINAANDAGSYTGAGLAIFHGTTNIRLGIGTDNGVDKLQVTGTVSHSPATMSTQSATLGQVKGAVSGTANYIAKFTGTNVVGNSILYETGGNVGIGTTTPSKRLTSSNTQDFQLSIEHTGTGGGAWNFGVSGDNWSTYSGAKLLISPNTTSGTVMTLQPNGNVGIGTISPAAKLDIASGNLFVGTHYNTSTLNTLFLAGQYPGINQEVQRPSGGASFKMFDLQAYKTGAVGQSAWGQIGAFGNFGNAGEDFVPTVTYIYFGAGSDVAYNNNTFRLYPNKIANFQGNVGIGTTAPAAKLDINSSSTDGLRITSSTSSPWIKLKTSNAGEIGTGGIVWHTSTDALSSAILSRNTVADNNLEFYTGGTQKVLISSAGNVGIGTVSPSDKLDVIGSAKITNTSAGLGTVPLILSNLSSTDLTAVTLSFSALNTATVATGTIKNIRNAENDYSLILDSYTRSNTLVLRNDNVGIGTAAPRDKLSIMFAINSDRQLDFRYFNGAAILSNSPTIGVTDTGGAFPYNAFGNLVLQSRTTGGVGNILFNTGDAADTRMAILNNGNVLIGTTTDNGVDKLQVNGSMVATSVKITNLTDGFIPYHSSDAVGFVNGPLSVSGSSVSSAGTITASNFILSSDRRLKAGIRPATELDWVDDIKFKEFYFKAGDGKLRYGVIAQDVEKINKNLVNEKEDGMKGVSYIDLLIAKVARQDEIINELIKKLEKLEKNEK